MCWNFWFPCIFYLRPYLRSPGVMREADRPFRPKQSPTVQVAYNKVLTRKREHQDYSSLRKPRIMDTQRVYIQDSSMFCLQNYFSCKTAENIRESPTCARAKYKPLANQKSVPIPACMWHSWGRAFDPKDKGIRLYSNHGQFHTVRLSIDSQIRKETSTSHPAQDEGPQMP
jgi:hypothetical protein